LDIAKQIFQLHVLINSYSAAIASISSRKFGLARPRTKTFHQYAQLSKFAAGHGRKCAGVRIISMSEFRWNGPLVRSVPMADIVIALAEVPLAASYSQLIPASGNTLCKIAPRQISTTRSLRRLVKRLSLTNFSMAQKQIAPTTHIIRTPIKTESIAISSSYASC
jgi:hypothetical protein